MPVKSKAQARAMFAAAQGKSNLGIPQSVGKEFTQATHSLKSLPEKVGFRLRKLAKKRKAKRKKRQTRI